MVGSPFGMRCAALALAAVGATALYWLWRRKRRASEQPARLVGVPEAVNMPWQGLEAVAWRDISLGTGEMCRMLRAGEADAAVLLLEGAVNDIVAKRGPHKIVSECVASPLTWGGDEA